MITTLLILVIFLLVVLLVVILRFTSKGQAMEVLVKNLEGMHGRLDSVSKELGSVQEIGRSMRDLQNFLRSPKLRGNVGEQVLHDLLSQSFPQNFFEMQYKFKTGQIVDAVLKTDQGFISIDAKFPLENFHRFTQTQEEAYKKDFFRDVKKHISDVSSKYILPEEGTVEFALLYVPAEAVFYEIIRSEEDLQQFAWNKKVLLVSPNTFFYFLKILMIGMQGKRIEEASKRVLSLMQTITKDARKFGDALGLVNTHMNHAKSGLDRLNTEYSRLSTKIDEVNLLK